MTLVITGFVKNFLSEIAERIIVDKFTEVPAANITSDRLIRLLPGQNRIVNLADYCLIVPLSVNLTYRKS